TTARCKPGQGVPDEPLPFRQNQFGATLTGPIFKNRTFFSAGYDGWRYSQPTLALAYVPTAAEINGDFSNTPFRRRIYNPYSTRLVNGNFVRDEFRCDAAGNPLPVDRKSTRLNSSHSQISYAVFCLKKKKITLVYHATPRFSLKDFNISYLSTAIPRPQLRLPRNPSPLFKIKLIDMLMMQNQTSSIS